MPSIEVIEATKPTSDNAEFLRTIIASTIMNKRFRVAFSFSAEARTFVAGVARILASRFGSKKIFYDQYHQAELARSDLDLHLSSIYRNETDLVVAVLSPGYDRKEWCGLEWAATYSRVRSSDSNNVMLFRFGHVEGVGVYGVAGFIDLDNRTPDDAANLILQRLAVQDGHSPEYYSSAAPTSEWPEVAPRLEWLVADLNEVREALSQLMIRDAPYRMLFIKGHSGTGKTLVARHLVASALMIPALRCGLLDFKGGSSIVTHFAHDLGIEASAGGGAVSIQLDGVLLQLSKMPRPTLLVLDMFERAGESELWVTQRLLRQASGCSWLRLVIAGQRVPEAQGETWARFARQVKLVEPTAEDWFQFGREFHSDLSLPLVRNAYKLADGRSLLLAQLFGPLDRG